VTEDVVIRKTVTEDWARLWTLLQHMGLTKSRARSRELLESFIGNDQHCLTVAEANNELIGYAWAQSYGQHLRTLDITARLHDLFVLPTHRKRGIAEQLLKAVIEWAKVSNVKYLQWQANKASAAFYERLGYGAIPDPDPEHPFFEIEFK
jgi:GNAT superfamily N-acetyltransferase